MAPDTTYPTVSVVILAYKRLERLRETLQHTLHDLDYPADKLELIVVDNASENGTPEMLAAEFPEVKVIVHEKNLGTSGWNAGLVAGTGKWTLMLDDDGHLEGTDLKEAVEAAEEHGADLVSFRSVSAEDRTYFFDTFYPTGLLSFWGTAALLSRRAIAETGGFDPNIFIWGNELELTMRLLDAGLTHLNMPNIAAVHMKKRQVEGEPVVWWMYSLNQRNLAYVCAKGLRWRDLVPAQTCRVLRVLFDGHVLGREALGALPGLVRGTVDGLRARKPLRPELSSIYRQNFPDFRSPFVVVRGPVERLRARGNPELAARDREARSERIFARRRRFFPTEPAVFTLPAG
jgi:GT2 family glycosyltransferase